MGGGMGATVCVSRQAPNHLGLRPTLVLCINFCNEKIRGFSFSKYLSALSRAFPVSYTHVVGKYVPETDGNMALITIGDYLQ
jgi:hypothetical protein